MKIIGKIILVIVVLAVIAGVGVFAFRYGESQAAVNAQQAQLNQIASPARTRGIVQAVRTVPLRDAAISETLTAYGTVVGKASEIRNVSVPVDTKVMRVLVSAGQRVRQGQSLIQVQLSPQALLRLAEARSSMQAAEKNLDQVNQRFKLKLTTQRHVLRAQQAYGLARLRLRSLQRRGADLGKPLQAPTDGVVANIAVQTGQIVPAGSPLLEMVSGHHIEVRLGVEPGYVPELHAGQTIRMAPVNQALANSFSGTIRLITRRVNPDTRLVNVFVSVPRNVPLILNGYVRGSVVIARRKTLLAPRKAVLPVGGNWVLYTVYRGHAVRHIVKLGLRNDRYVQVIGQGLAAGMPVVIRGNYELSNQMAVRMEKQK